MIWALLVFLLCRARLREMDARITALEETLYAHGIYDAK